MLLNAEILAVDVKSASERRKIGYGNCCSKCWKLPSDGMLDDACCCQRGKLYTNIIVFDSMRRVYGICPGSYDFEDRVFNIQAKGVVETWKRRW
jgi:hypothetical protein